jgi:hypothetical protein
MINSFFEDVLLPHIQTQLQRAPMPPEFLQSKLRAVLDRCNTRLQATYGTPPDLRQRHRLLLGAMLASGVCTSKCPTGLNVQDCVAYLVVFPRLCHAVFFSADLLLDAESPLLDTKDNKLWVQLVNTKIADTRWTETETPIMNPLQYFRQKNLCFVKRAYEPTTVLFPLALSWAKHLRLRGITSVPPPRALPYVESFRNMSLYEVCFYLCLEHAIACRWIKVMNRITSTFRPFRWRVPTDIKAEDLQSLRDLFPRFFLEAPSENVWCTRLCIGCVASGAQTRENPWERVFQPGYEYFDFRFTKNFPWHLDWSNELTSFSSS